MSDTPLLDWIAAASYPDGIPADVCLHFERLALELVKAGFEHYSADAILHRLRWNFHVERGDRTFKINNDYAAPLARWFLKQHPEAKGFFELRQRKAAPIRAYAD